MSHSDPTDLRRQERDRADADKRAKLARETEDEDLRWLMKCRQGRRVVWRQLDRAGVFRSVFNTNAMQMAFTEGNRNGGLQLLAQINAVCPEFYQTMVSEANDRHLDDN